MLSASSWDRASNLSLNVPGISHERASVGGERASVGGDLSPRRQSLASVGPGDLASEVRDMQSELAALGNRMSNMHRDTGEATRILAEAKEQLFLEADIASDLYQDLDDKYKEHRGFQMQINGLRDLLHHEMQDSEADQDHLANVEMEVQEHTLMCQSLQVQELELEESCAGFLQASESEDKNCWRSRMMRTKLYKAEESFHTGKQHLISIRGILHRDGERIAELRCELAQAQERLQEESEAAANFSAQLADTTEGLSKTESRLDDCADELRLLTQARVEDMKTELDRRKVQQKEAEDVRVQAVAKTDHWRSRLAPTLARLLSDEASQADRQRHLAGLSRAKGEAEVENWRSELESIQEEATELRNAVVSARQRQLEAEELAEKRAAVEEADEVRAEEEEAKVAKTRLAQEAMSQQAQQLSRQLALREREQAHRETVAAECEAQHQQELRLLGHALHRLGQTYWRRTAAARRDA